VYSPNGSVAIQISADPRPTSAATSRDDITADDALRALRGYYAYFGRYTIEDGAPWQLSGPVLVQRVEASVWPIEEVGREYVRPYSLRGDTLVLRAWQGTGWTIQRWLRDR
jgi:hypothetical protein